MRLLFVSHSFPPADAPMNNVGGMQRVATELHAALLARDDVALRTLALRSSWKWVHVKAVPFLVSLTARLVREAERFGADAILFTSMTTALPLLLAGPGLKKRGVLLGAIAHGLDVTAPNRAYQAAVHRLCQLLDVAMPVSRAAGEELIKRGLPRDRMRVVPNAADIRRFEGIAEARSRAAELQVPGAPPLEEDAFLLITVGRQVRRKGFVWFIENVMPKVSERTVFWLAGDGPERDDIEAAISRMGLQDRVHRLGRVSEAELLEIYRRGQLFVMPNIAVPGDMEGFGIVMLEAGACGMPTLAADLEGLRDVVEEGVNGWLVPSGDADAFAGRIERLKDDPKALRAAGRRSADHVRRSFTWERTASLYLEALECKR